MPTTGYDVYNLRNIVNAAASFRFSEGATLTRAQAIAAGWWDVGHVTATDITPSATTTSHKYCRLGKLGTDKQFVTDVGLVFGVQCEELTRFNLLLALMGAPAPDLAQAAVNAATLDSLWFTTAKPSAGANVWYNLTQNGTPLRELAAVSLSAPARAAGCDPATGKIALAAHGWSNGTPLVFGGATRPAGLGEGVYYVTAAGPDDFQVSATPGGAAASFTSAGADVTVTQQLADGAGALIDFKTGAARFLYPVVQEVTVTATAPAIDANHNPGSLLQGVYPLRHPNRAGYGRLLFYADEAENQLVGDYLFQCQITPKGASNLDGAKAPLWDFTLTVLADTGTFYVAP
jgi:hypothetical protein